MHKRRRQLLAALVAAAPGSPLRAQPAERSFRIGFVSGSPSLQVLRAYAPAPQILAALERYGYVEGRNLTVDYEPTRSASMAHLEAAAAILVQRRPDLIVAVAVTPSLAVKRATRAIPIVAWGTHGAVETGLVSNLRRPGGNVTGTETLAPETDAKRLELFKQLLPGLTQLAVLTDTVDAGVPFHMQYIRAAGTKLGLNAVTELRASQPDPAALEPLLAEGAAGVQRLLVVTTNRTWNLLPKVLEWSLARRMPVMCELRQQAQAGCLLSYGPTLQEINERTAAQIDKILRGTPPGDLPVEQPTRFELVINLKTARALGVTVPRDLLLRADAVIE